MRLAVRHITAQLISTACPSNVSDPQGEQPFKTYLQVYWFLHENDFTQIAMTFQRFQQKVTVVLPMPSYQWTPRTVGIVFCFVQYSLDGGAAQVSNYRLIWQLYIRV